MLIDEFQPLFGGKGILNDPIQKCSAFLLHSKRPLKRTELGWEKRITYQNPVSDIPKAAEDRDTS